DAWQVNVDIPILILGAGRHSMHQGAIGIVRSAGRLGIPAFHAYEGRRSPLERSRYSRGKLALPPSASASDKLRGLGEFAARNGRSVLIPVDDASAMFVGDRVRELERDFLFPRQPDGLARSLANKREMYR